MSDQENVGTLFFFFFGITLALAFFCCCCLNCVTFFKKLYAGTMLKLDFRKWTTCHLLSVWVKHTERLAVIFAKLLLCI